MPLKRSFMWIGMLSSALAVKAQKQDTLFEKKNIPETAIRILFSYYSQNGDNSAVTGGTGTEKLSVYAPHLSLDHKRGNGTIKLDGGVDIITSASTDKIDFVVSSASLHDARIYAHGGYERSFPKKHMDVGIKTGFSVESDYFSVPVLLNVAYNEPSLLRSYGITLESYFDDLRWGRLNEEYYKPVKLIYPSELRYKEWFDEYKRNTFNIGLSFSQVINKRLITGIMPSLSYQDGLLATPFHRVYFTDDSVKVENLPDSRIKFPLGLKLNYFAGSRTILKARYDFYVDDWGLTANAVQLEAAIKINPKFALSPFFRIYHQSGIKYFKPYGEHTVTEAFYTSDFDLSRFTSYKPGLGFRYSPINYGAKKISFNELELRYSAYFQSTGLNAQSLTMLLYMNLEKMKQRKD